MNHPLPFLRPRRNRKTPAIRNLLRETQLTPSDFILPLFVCEGKKVKDPISSMPGVYRLSTDNLVTQVKEAHSLHIPAVALFPVISPDKKDTTASESTNPHGLLQTTIQQLKEKCPDIAVVTDVAMDPYSIHGHDGLVRNGHIDNDATLEILAAMAVSQSEAGADIVAPSDMMDGRVGYIREALDENGFTGTSILAYSAKYASAFYGPFREALDSAPRKDADVPADKKTYQMDPANMREALREVRLDEAEGADMLMVKPALAYLDIIRQIKYDTVLPVAAYQVSGEYAMLKAAAEKGWLSEKDAFLEALVSIKRAGADVILSYYAVEAAKQLS